MRRLSLLLFLAGVLVTGCDRSQPPQTPAADEAPSIRIVTLAPALSKMIVDLGKGDLIVGISQYDDAAPPGLPTVGHFMDVNTEAMFELRPTHVMMMSGQGGVPEVLETLKRSMGFKLYAWPYPYNITDVCDILADGPQTSIGAVLGVPDRARMLKNRMLLQLGNIDRVTDVGDRPLTLLVIGLQGGVMASGPGSVFDSLFAFIGALNAVADEKTSAPVLDREKLQAARPEVILLMLPNDPPLGDFATDSRVSIFRGLDIPAVTNRRIALINDPLSHLPATNIPEIAAKMAKAIHPKLSDKIDAALASDKPVSAPDESP